MGGLLAPPIAGAVILASRRANAILIGLCAAILVSLAIWVRSMTGFIALPLVAGLIVAGMRWGNPDRRMILAKLIGVTLAIDTVSGSGYLFTGEATVNGVTRKSDISNVAAAFGGHYLVWGLLLAAISFGLLAVGLRISFGSGSTGKRARPKP